MTNISDILEKIDEADKMIRNKLSPNESLGMPFPVRDALKESRLLLQEAINKLLAR